MSNHETSRSLKIALHPREATLARAEAHQVGPHVDQELHALGQSVELREEPHARRHQRPAHPVLGGVQGFPLFGLHHRRGECAHRTLIDAVVACEQAQEALPAGLAQGSVAVPQLRRPAACGHLAAASREAGLDLLPHPLQIALGKVGSEVLHRIPASSVGRPPPRAHQPAPRALEPGAARVSGHGRYPSHAALGNCRSLSKDLQNRQWTSCVQCPVSAHCPPAHAHPRPGFHQHGPQEPDAFHLVPSRQNYRWQWNPDRLLLRPSANLAGSEGLSKAEMAS